MGTKTSAETNLAAGSIDGSEEMRVAKSGSNFRVSYTSFLTWLGISNFLPKTGAVQGGTVQPQEFVSTVKAVNNTDSTEAGLNTDGSITTITKNGSVFLNVVTKSIKVSLSSAQMQTASSTPIEAVADPGAGKLVKAISAEVNIDNGDTPFSCSNLFIYNETAVSADSGYHKKVPSGILSGAVDWFGDMIVDPIDRISGVQVCIPHKTLLIKADADSPGADGTVDIYLTYQIITL